MNPEWMHDLCRVKAQPVTLSNPYKVGDIFATNGAWNRKYMLTDIVRAECPDCGRVHECYQLKFLGLFHATGKVKLSTHDHTIEYWSCYGGIGNKVRVVSRFSQSQDQRIPYARTRAVEIMVNNLEIANTADTRAYFSEMLTYDTYQGDSQ